MKANIKHLVLTIGFIAALLIPASAAYAQNPPAGGNGTDGGQSAKGQCPNSVTFFPRWYDGLCNADGGIMSPNEMNSGKGTEGTANNLGKWLSIIALNIVEILLFAVGYVSLGFIIFGGFKYMTSGDNSSGTQAARKTITNAVIGLLLSIMSIAIVNFVTEYIR